MHRPGTRASRDSFRTFRSFRLACAMIGLTCLTIHGASLPRAARAMPAPGDVGPTDPAVTDNTGAARFRVPIEVPPGPGGFAPHLELSYSSRSGDGPLGVGWSVGIPEIHCSGRFGAQDFMACARFELSDQPLVAHPSIPHRFHTFVESFQRIDYHLSGDWWSVVQTDGTTLYFGTTSAHRVAQDGGTARWLLERMEDAFGNGIYFSYDTATDPGSAYPKAIHYGADAGAGSGPRQVAFVYEVRPDAQLVFSAGLRREIGQRLREIRVFGHGALARRYALEYADTVGYATDRSRLESIQEFGSDCTEASTESCTGLPATTLVYRDAGDIPTQGPGEQWTEADAYRIPFGSYPVPGEFDRAATLPQLIGDLNGDGLPDRLELYPAEAYAVGGWNSHDVIVRVWINTGGGFDGISDDSEWADIATDFTRSFGGLTYDRLRLDYAQIPVPAGYGHGPTEGGVTYDDFWMPGIWPDGGYYAMCSVSDPVVEPNQPLAPDLSELGLSARTSYASTLAGASIGNPVGGSLRARPSIRLADLDSDGLADLIVSTHVGSITRHFDCNGNPVAPESTRGAAVTAVFRNTGTGWVRDPSLAQGMPPFEELAIESSYQASLDYSSLPWIRGGGSGFIQFGEASTPCANLGVFGFEQSGFVDPLGQPVQANVCYAPVDLAPQFHDFDGDGFLDVAVLQRDHPDQLLTGVVPLTAPPNEAHTVVWIQDPSVGAAQRWVRGPQYDLPSDLAELVAGGTNPLFLSVFAHVVLQSSPGDSTLQCWSWDDNFPWCSPAMYRLDPGVRFADMNRDGLADVVWSGPGGAAVLLNTGRGSSASSSAWCISSGDPTQAGLVGGSCPEAARYLPPLPISQANPGGSVSEKGRFADLNGDGWLDFITIDTFYVDALQTAAYLFAGRDDGDADGYWERDTRFDLPIRLAADAPHPLPGGAPDHCAHGYNCYLVNPVPARTAFVVFDVNGDGADDVIGDFQAFLAKPRHGDLLREIDNGRGGRIEIAYASAIQQRDAALEAAVADPGPGAGDAILWRPTPVVSRVTVTGPDFAPAQTGYTYARPGFCPTWRSEEGFRLIETVRPDTSRVRETFYQDHGRAGRTLERLVIEEGQVVHRYQADWEHVGSVVPGTIAGVFHARLESEQTGSEFGGVAGATTFRTLTYDDIHGYDFATEIETERPTGTLVETRLPYSIPADHIVGLIARSTLADGAGAVLRDTRLVYFDPDGASTAPKVGQVEEWVGDRDDFSSARWVEIAAFRYDAYGNLVEEQTPSPTGTGLRSTRHCYDGDTTGVCASPSGQVSHSVRVASIDPLGGVVVTIPDAARGVPLEIGSSYTDEPARRVELDPLGRPAFEYATPEGRPEVLVAKNTYHDDVGFPLWVERFEYSDASQGDFLYSGTVFGAFGATWKRIERTPSNYVGVVTRRDFASRIERVTLPLDCGQDPACASFDGQTQPAARQSTTDALGRPLRIDTPEGFSVLAYFPVTARGYPAGLGGAGPFDGMLVKNGKGDLLQRVFDGGRPVWVDECHDGVDPELASLAQASCGNPSGADTTLYAYEATGELHTVYDATAVRIGSYADPDHFLRYVRDTLGRTVRIEDPDLEGTGFQSTLYGDAGSIASTTNARGHVRTFAYDDLSRLVGITTPAGEDDYTVRYRPGERQRAKDMSAAYQRVRIYDAWGRLEQTRLTVAETNGGPFLMDYVYDVAGRVVEQVYPESTRIRYEYDGASLVRVCDLGDGTACGSSGAVDVVSDVTYDALGRRDQTFLGAGTRDFDYVGSTARLARDRFDGNVSSADPYSYQLDYTAYDGLGNVTRVTGTSRYGDIDLNESYAYDARNRLATWTKEGVSYDYRYDELGNLTLHAGAAQAFDDAGRPHAITRRVDAGVSYGRDADGNATSIVEGGSARYLTFDSANRLVCVDRTTAGGCGVTRIHYDADGEKVLDDLPAALGYTVYVVEGTRIEGAVPRRVRIEVRAFGERVALKRSTGAIRRSSAAPLSLPPEIWGALLAVGAAGLLLGATRSGALVAAIARPARVGTACTLAALLALGPLPHSARAGGGSDSVMFWELTDPLGSGLVIVDGGGQRVVHRTFEPFGRLHASTSDAEWIPRHYAGHLWEGHIGLYSMQARWMDPASGTFLSVDPLVPGASDPQTLNAYAYARNNPTSMTDPTGGFPLEELQSCNRCSGFYNPGYAILGDGSIMTAGQISVQNYNDAKALRDAGMGDSLGAMNVLSGIGAFLKGVIDLAIGEDFGAVWRSLFGEWTEAPASGMRLPKALVEALERAGAAVPPDASANGMNAWHAGSNAALARALGLVGAPFILLAGILHETPLDPASFMAEQAWQGTVNHFLDSATDIGANVFGLMVGYAIPRTSWAVDTAARLGNYIPGPGEPDPTFGGHGHSYSGDPSAAWGQYP